MITTIKQILFTDKKKDGTPLINKGWVPFKMLHLELKDWTWVSKYYKQDDYKPELEVNVEYDIRIKQNWQYYNLIAIYTLDEDPIDLLETEEVEPQTEF